MKKFFLIPLLTLVCSVMAWGETWPVSTWQDLFDAIYSASLQDGDVISFQNDITFPSDKQGKFITEDTGYGTLCIRKSITIEGNNYSLTGSGKRSNGTYVTLGINQAGTQAVAVTIQNLSIINNKGGRALECRGTTAKPITALTLTNCYLSGKNGTLTIGRNHTNKPLITITNSTINGNGSYPILTFNPFIMNIDNSTISGYCGIYFKSPDGSAGSRGAVVTATNSTFNCSNSYAGKWNSFGVFALEDDGITITLNNCGVDARELSSARSTLITLSPWTPVDRRVNDVVLNINGDNSYVMGRMVSAGWDLYYAAKDAYDTQVLSASDPDYSYFVYENGTVIHDDGDTILVKESSLVFDNMNPASLTISITGGTYAYNPENVKFIMHEYEGEDAERLAKNIDSIRIPDEYEVKEIETQQGGLQTTLYRVRKKITTSYSINQDVEGQGAGQNEHTEFLISGDETVAANSTVANYVEVSNNATLTLPEGKKLEVTNGLDVTGGATLDVAAGSTLVVGEGGVTSENTGSIVIESNENGSASFLLSPEVIVNTTPNLTVKMTVKGKGYKNESAGKTYYWHRFAAPVVMAEEWSKAPSYGTWLYGWDYTAEGGKGAWAELPTSMAMVPFQGYTLSPEHLVASEAEEIVYSFKGQLAGNQNMNLQFNARGFNFFGNSYTGYIDVLTLVDQLMGNENIDGSVYMWNNGEQGYEPVSLQDLKVNPSHYLAWQKEIAPMQTFILRQINTGDDVSTLLNYENSIWKNPRYGNVPAPAPAPKRAAADADPFVRVMITAANGQNSQMSFAENADRSDDFEKGYDALKYMNENTINVYSTLDGQDYANVATNDLEGKTITLQTNDEIAYTMSFLVAEGEQYAIRDNATNQVIAIEEGATYDFAAQPNSVIEGRFEIIPVAKMPTSIENTEVKANVKGIYTITGQYVGEDFEAVPAGVYVVNGVKIVK